MASRTSALVLTFTLGLAACGQADPAGVAQPVAVQAEPTPTDLYGNPYQLEGSVTDAQGSFVAYPNGLTVRVAGLERIPAEHGANCDPTGHCEHGVPDGRQLVRVKMTYEVAAGTPAAVPLETTQSTQLLYGPNRITAPVETGFAGEPLELNTNSAEEQPTQVAPGSQIVWYSTFLVPADQLNTLAVTVMPSVRNLPMGAALTPYTFTDAETLLK